MDEPALAHTGTAEKRRGKQLQLQTTKEARGPLWTSDLRRETSMMLRLLVVQCLVLLQVVRGQEVRKYFLTIFERKSGFYELDVIFHLKTEDNFC